MKNRSAALGDEATTYMLHLREQDNHGPSSVSQFDIGAVRPVFQFDTGASYPLSKFDTGGSTITIQAPVPISDTQETVVQETALQQTEENDSNRSALKKQVIRVAVPTNNESAEADLVEQGESDTPYSPYIAGVVIDFSRELSDVRISSNVSQALHLWQLSGLNETAFVQQLYEAKLRTRKAQSVGINNKGAYLFTVLRDILGLRS